MPVKASAFEVDAYASFATSAGLGTGYCVNGYWYLNTQITNLIIRSRYDYQAH
jgi:hypothetical protein